MNKLKNALFLLLAKWLTTFSTSPNYLAFVGAGSAGKLCTHIVRSGFTRVFVVTDKPLRDIGIVDQALSGFADTGVEYAIYDGVQPNPSFAQAAEGTAMLKQHDADAVLAIGGGSAMDCAKLIAASATSDADPKGWIGLGKVKHDALPIFAIPTTAGTGSEATMGAVISDTDSGEKGVISGTTLGPRATALDPELQLGLPPHITAATGMDALTHAVEAYICRWERGTSKEHARQAIDLVFKHLRDAYDNGNNLETREAMALAAYYAGIAINQVNVGNVHAVAHQLGGKYGMPHGLANALVLPHMLEFMLDEAEGSLAELAELISATSPGQSRRDQALAFIDAVSTLREAVGIAPTSEQILPEDFDYLTRLAVNEATGYFSPRLLDEPGTRQILGRITQASGASA